MTLTNLAADSTMDVFIDINKSLMEQDLSDGALDTFSILYYLYVSDDKTKEELLTSWSYNDNN